MTLQNPEYPVRLEVEYPERLSRLLIFVKWLLAIPHFIALTLLGIGAFVAAIIGWFAVLFTGRWPEGLFNYIVGVMRWGARVGAYIYLLTDRYPPFTPGRRCRTTRCTCRSTTPSRSPAGGRCCTGCWRSRWASRCT